MLFRLAKVVDSVTNIYVTRRIEKPNGSYRKGEHMRLEPGVIYDTDGDDVFEKSIRALMAKKIAYTAEMEQKFKDTGTDYKVIACKSCGGRVKKIEFKVVEEVTNA